MTPKMKQELIQKQKLPEEWKIVKLGELAEFLRGPFGSSVQKSVCIEKGPNTYKLYEQGNVINNDFQRGTYYLGKENFQQLKKFEIKSGDILITCAGTLGRIAVVPEKIERGIINSVLMRIRLNNSKILTKYFIYYFKSPQFNGSVLSKSFGAAIKNMFATKELKQFTMFLPPLPVQQQIVSKLDAQMAQIGIMKKEAEKEKEASEEILQSFLKKELYDNQKEWKKFKIEDLCFLKTGGTPSKDNNSYWRKGTINWLASGDLNQEIIYEVEGKITQEGLNNSNAKILPVNSILIALNGQGKTRGMVAVLKVESTCNQSIVAFVPKDDKQLDYLFLFYYLKGLYQKLRNLTGDNERSGLSIRILNNYQIQIPKIETQKGIVKKIEQFNKEQKTIKEQINQKLSAISLLPSSILNEVFGKYEITKDVENGE